jgi:hypothetical protein
MRISAFVVMALLLAACSPGDHPAGRSAGRPAVRGATPAPGGTSPSPAASASPVETPGRAGGRTVVIAVGGTTRRAVVTYTAPDGSRRRDTVSPPWRRTFTVYGGRTVDVAAHSDAGGSLTCSLKVDGDVLKDAMSSGDSMTVDCGDDIGF